MIPNRGVLAVHAGVVGVQPPPDLVSLFRLGSGDSVEDVALVVASVAEEVEKGREDAPEWSLRPKDVDHCTAEKTDREEDIRAHAWRVARSRIRVNNRLDVTGWQVEEG